MCKKLLVLVGAAVMLVFGACKWEMPQAIEVRAKPKLDLPVDPKNANLGDMLFNNIKNAMDSDNITVLDYENYKVKNKNVMTFLINYSIAPQGDNIDFDFTKQLRMVDDLNLGIEDFEMAIDANDLTDFTDMDIDPIKVELELDGLFGEIEDKINEKFQSGNNTSNLLAIDNFPVGGGLVSPVPFPNGLLGGNTISFTAIMNEASFKEGILRMELRIEEPSINSNLFNAKITFTDIEIMARDKDGNPYNIRGYEEFGDPDTDISFTLENDNPSVFIEFDLADSIIDGNFQMRIGTYQDASTGFGNVKLVLHPDEVYDLKFREVKGLNISEYPMDIDPDTIELPSDIDDTFFIHAEVAVGTLTFDIENDPATFTHDGFDFDYSIILEQNSHPYGTSPKSPYQGLNGTFTETNTSLADKHIVPVEDINVHAGSKFILKPPTSGDTRANFWIHDDCLDAGFVELNIIPKLQIDLFKEVDIDITDKLDDFDFEIEPVSLEDAAEYLKWMQFTSVGPVITFDEVDIPGLKIMISEPQLGIYPGAINPTGAGYKDIPEGGGEVKFINDTPTKIYLQQEAADAADKPLVTELNFTADVKAGDGGVITLKNLDPNNANIKFKMGHIDFESEWDQMQVDSEKFGAFEGAFPGQLTDENGDPVLDDDGNPVDGDPIDLSSLGEYLNGFEFKNIESYLYVSGPEIFFEKFEPSLSISVAYTKDNNPDYTHELDSGTVFQNAKGLLNFNPVKGTYKGKLPARGVPIDLESILEDLPNDLRFKYEVNLDDDAIIYNDDLKEFDDIDEPLKMDIILVIPLSLTAGENGADISLSNITKASESDSDDEENPGSGEPPSDLLGREANGDGSLFDYIKSLNLKLELDNSVFKNGEIFLDDRQFDPDDETIVLKGKRLKFPLDGSTLNLPITGAKLDYINKTIPWAPDIGIHFKPGGNLVIPRNLGVVKIKFDADIQAKIPLAGGDK